MGDVLSQSEVESLLAALDPGAQQHFSEPSRQSSSAGQPQVSVYDFKRPERVSKEQMRAFQALHEGFSREFGASLSGMLRAIVEVKLISVDQLTYSEFVFSLENPTCFNLLESQGLEGHVILDINPSIIYPIIDRLLGGGKESNHDLPSRPLTEIELQIVSRITRLAISGLESAWSNVCDLRLKVLQVESNPQLVQIVPPNEVIVLISFELTMGDTRGIMNLCIPYNTIEPLSARLSSDNWSTYTRKVADPRQRLNLERGVAQAKVGVVVRLASTRLTASEVADLEVGDVITTSTRADGGIDLLVEGRPMFRGHPGLLNGHKAISLEDQIIAPNDLIEQELKRRGIPSVQV